MITVEFNAPGYPNGFGAKWERVLVPPQVGDVIQGKDQMAEKRFVVCSRYWRETNVLVLGITEIHDWVMPKEGE